MLIILFKYGYFLLSILIHSQYGYFYFQFKKENSHVIWQILQNAFKASLINMGKI